MGTKYQWSWAIALLSAIAVAGVGHADETGLGNRKPQTPVDSDTGSVELGVRFQSSINGVIKAIRFYRGSGRSASFTVSLWDASGKRLATAKGQGAAPGYITVALPKSIAISANTNYIASYLAPRGRYAGDVQGFAQSIQSGHLILNQGVYHYGKGGVAPSSVYRDTNYYVDVVFNAADVASAPAPAPTPKPEPTPVQPAPTPEPTPVSGSPATIPDYCAKGGAALWNNLEACGWPGKNNTGPSGNLVLKSGGFTVNAPGVYENMDIHGVLSVNASGATIRNFRVTDTGGFTSVYVAHGVKDVVFEDCEVDPQFKNQFAIWVYDTDTKVTVRRCELHNAGNGIQVGQGLVFEDNYCHDIDEMPNDGENSWHVNCVINLNDSRGISNMIIRHNTMRLGTPGGAHPFSGVLNLIVQDNVTIENNLMANGSYTVYLFDSRYGGHVPSNSKVINNKFSTVDSSKVGQYNIWYPGQGFDIYAPYITFTGNTVLETGKAVNGTQL
jgi:hypothetical protein